MPLLITIAFSPLRFFYNKSPTYRVVRDSPSDSLVLDFHWSPTAVRCSSYPASWPDIDEQISPVFLAHSLTKDGKKLKKREGARPRRHLDNVLDDVSGPVRLVLLRTLHRDRNFRKFREHPLSGVTAPFVITECARITRCETRAPRRSHDIGVPSYPSYPRWAVLVTTQPTGAARGDLGYRPKDCKMEAKDRNWTMQKSSFRPNKVILD